ncbi:MAG: ATP-dependent Clp protease proteolytic subunit [Candidatus Omnitrophica bacterium]|nr:MAG: ATP-dependent Clp protease proteolytic subunit [Candidatus Hinthialibacteria bacterium OLB16]MBE7489593.1 ATP-dependent Clp protease proteolytic subunit [bacterium]MBK7495126.1 ATP-dependent Clp protease proteolytic subunit [Candidatus Omnitrophota bacterium]MCE7908785.1 ATP-dependent Clp protease proteolytic subunit [Candidatus Omnitrophica bacterium COP1]MBW7938436.1 ATP-dependent Clp protease proteolytic subunit [Candidatus Omnitrophota bacterium]
MVQRFACDDEPTPRDNGLAPRLLKARTILLTGEIDHELAERVVAQLLILDAESHDPIRMIITSNGGHIESGFAIYDVMRFIESKIITVGAGWVVSMAVPILLGAQKENRLSLPNTRFMIHQPIGGVGGQATDVRIAAQEIIKIRERINHLLAAETGQPLEKIAADSDRNFWLSAEEARQYGLVSRIIQSARDI